MSTVLFSKSSSNTTSTTVAAVAGAALVAVQLLTPADPIGRCLTFLRQLRRHERRLSCNKSVSDGIDAYNDLYSHTDPTLRNQHYKSLVNSYYDLATVFYEWGWSASFHFAYRYSMESFGESIRRHEYYLASKLQLLGTNKHVLDVGCGIGGPLRNMARFLQTQSLTGITLNPYQVQRGNELCQADDTVRDKCRLVQGDFMEMPFADTSMDAAYAIEATCHAPDRVKVYREVHRVLKPNAVFATYEWCMTDAYDAKNPTHNRIKKQIEEGDGLPDMVHTSVCVEALKEAGFEVLETRDMAQEEEYGSHGKPWMLPLMPSWNPLTQRFQFNCVGWRMTNAMIVLLEFLWLAPKGTVKTQRMLQQGAFGLADGGTTKIFTPMYLMVARKRGEGSDGVVVDAGQ